jgi:hypothetical protein
MQERGSVFDVLFEVFEHSPRSDRLTFLVSAGAVAASLFVAAGAVLVHL